MNVLYITHISSFFTGANRSLYHMLVGLKSKGVKPIVLLSPYADMTLKVELDKIGVQSYIIEYYMPVLPNNDSFRDKLLYLPKILRSKFRNLLARRKISKIVQAESIDIIHTNVGPLLLGYEVANKLNIPHVWHLREFQDLDFSMKTWYTKKGFLSMLNHENNQQIAISRAIYEHFHLKPPSTVIYNGIMKSSAARYNSSKSDYFLYVGHLSENKGIQVLLQAFSIFCQNNKSHNLLIAGDSTLPSYKLSLIDFLNEKGIGDRVSFLGHRNDVDQLMQSATALIVPSLNEAFGRITAEAMFNGCLVIGKNTGGTKEIIDLIGTGLLYDSVEELADLMLNLTKVGIENYSDELVSAMNKAKIKFSEESNAESVHRLYLELLKDRDDH
ncbi:glycosyltransferase family 4 protein [uncultured Pedobacter sp.]|uniref:glycosyltransferase family 4 protein n=1 Tax=uncultured Pedobacter sp. TaxID=246139 RepID=UPI0025FEA533|nr:glycosyltransferase family 4 protein [uncultured Pedobacter sp.]